MIDLTEESLSLIFYTCVIIGNFGIVTNMLNIFVSMKSEIMKIKTGFYFILISIFNILTIIFTLYLLLFPQSIGRPDLATTSFLACWLIPYLLRVVSQMVSWLNVVLTYDRMLCTTITYHIHFMYDNQKVKHLLLVMFVIICVLNLPNFFFHIEANTCTPNWNFITVLRDSVSMLNRIIVPQTLQTVFNVILIVRLFKKREEIDRPLEKERRFAFTVVISNIVFIVGEMPFLIATVFINMYGYNTTYITTTSIQAAVASFAFLCATAFLALVGYSSSLFVNIFTNKTYRNEVKKILGLNVR